MYKIVSNPFPIGYLKCSHCNRPALWLVSSDVYKEGYELISLKHPMDFIKDTKVICDTCSMLIDSEYVVAENLVFFEEVLPA